MGIKGHLKPSQKTFGGGQRPEERVIRKSERETLYDCRSESEKLSISSCSLKIQR